jgi:hypothetical protein
LEKYPAAFGESETSTKVACLPIANPRLRWHFETDEHQTKQAENGRNISELGAIIDTIRANPE